MLSRMHPTGQVLNFGNQREISNRGTENMHALIHIADAPTIDEIDSTKR